jgi:hypothetical protein
MQYVHINCLENWRKLSENPQAAYRCEQCLFEYKLSRVFTGDRLFIVQVLEHRFSVEVISLVILLVAIFFAGFISKAVSPESWTSFARIDFAHFSGGATILGLTSTIGWVSSGMTTLSLFNGYPGWGRWVRDSSGGGQKNSTNLVVVAVAAVGLMLALYWIYSKMKEYARLALQHSATVVLEAE